MSVGKNQLTVGKNQVPVGKNQLIVGKNQLTVGKNQVPVGKNQVCRKKPSPHNNPHIAANFLRKYLEVSILLRTFALATNKMLNTLCQYEDRLIPSKYVLINIRRQPVLPSYT